MKLLKRPQSKVSSLIALLCCTLITFLTGNAQAHERETIDSSAKAAVLIERNTGKVLLWHQADIPLPMASTTKIMTALLALEYGNMDDIVTVGRNAYGVPGTSIYLSLGEKITLRDLVYGLMLASGNDAAVAIAEHIAGDVESFCAMMTERARELGCKDTVFLNPNGLPASGHHTTAYDLALIARAAMKHDLFREIVSTQRASIPWEGRSYSRILNNKNKLLATYEGATGIKTGYTKAAGRCLVFGAKRDGLEVIGAVLNCGNWFEEATRLMDMVFSSYKSFTAFSEGDTVRVLPVHNGTQETVCVTAAESLTAVVKKGQIPALEIQLPEFVEAGRLQGETVGYASLVNEGEVLVSVPLVIGEFLAVRDYRYEISRIVRNWPAQEHAIAE